MKHKINGKFTTLIALVATLVCTLIAGVTLFAMPTNEVLTASAESLSYYDSFDAAISAGAVDKTESDGKIYWTLKRDIAVPTVRTPYRQGEVILDLAGYTLANNGTGGSVIRVGDPLTLIDSSGIVDGKYDRNKGTGTIKKGNANVGYEECGGGVEVYAQFEMFGGIIRDNKARFGGGVCVRSGRFIMHDGIITENETFAHGGGVALYPQSYDTCSFTMKGGEIKSNYAGQYGSAGIYISQNVEFNISGSPIVKNNTRTYNNVTKPSNIQKYTNSALINISADALTDGADLWLETEDGATITNGYTDPGGNTEAQLKYFHCDDENLKLELNAAGEIVAKKLTKAERWVKAVTESSADKPETFTLDGNWDADESHSFGTDERGFKDGGLFVPDGANVVLDLAGNTIDRKKGGGSVITVELGGELTIKGKSDNGIGKITGGYISGLNGGGLDVYGICTMDGGILIENTALSGGGVYIHDSGTFTMKDSVITKNHVLGSEVMGLYGGGVFVAGKFIINGGEITNNTIENEHLNTDLPNLGCGVYVLDASSAVVTISGKVVIGDNKNLNDVDKLSNFYIPNSLIYFKGNSMVNIGTLSEGAFICVDVDSANNPDYGWVEFTKGYSENNNGIPPSTYFKSDKGDVIKLKEEGVAQGEVYLSNIHSVIKPTYVLEDFIYSGNEREVQIEGLNYEYMQVTGKLKETAVGEYTVIISIIDKENNAWEDGTNDDIKFTWSIKATPAVEEGFDLPDNVDISNGGTITIPDNMTAELPDGWTVDEEGKVIIPDDVVNGEYKITLTPDKNHSWADGSTESKEFTINVSGGASTGDNTGDNSSSGGNTGDIGNGGGNTGSGGLGGLPEGGAVDESVWPWIVIAAVVLVVGGGVTAICVLIDRKNTGKKASKKNKK